MTTAGAEMLTKKYGVKMDSHLSKEQLAIARAFRSVQPNMRRNNKNTRSFFLSVFPDHKTQREKWQKNKKVWCWIHVVLICRLYIYLYQTKYDNKQLLLWILCVSFDVYIFATANS
jgi:hypothetical protein